MFMEELYVSPLNLKELIDNGKMVGEGYFGCVFTYQDKLIKLDRKVYYSLQSSKKNNSERRIEQIYCTNKDDFNDIDQINYLCDVQKNVKRTKFPLGALFLKDVDKSIEGISPGIIIPFHKGYLDLECLDKKDYKRVLILLKELLLSIRELDENHISHEDLSHYDANSCRRNYNIMFKDNDIALIDVSGKYLSCGKYFYTPKIMYQELGNVILDFYNYYNYPPMYKRNCIFLYIQNYELISELEERLNYEEVEKRICYSRNYSNKF